MRMISTSESVLNAQASIVHQFDAASFLKLNCTKSGAAPEQKLSSF